MADSLVLELNNRQTVFELDLFLTLVSYEMVKEISLKDLACMALLLYNAENKRSKRNCIWTHEMLRKRKIDTQNIIFLQCKRHYLCHYQSVTG